MDLSKLSKKELHIKCEEYGIKKYKSKNIKDLIDMISKKLDKKFIEQNKYLEKVDTKNIQIINNDCIVLFFILLICLFFCVVVSVCCINFSFRNWNYTYIYCK